MYGPEVPISTCFVCCAGDIPARRDGPTCDRAPGAEQAPACRPAVASWQNSGAGRRHCIADARWWHGLVTSSPVVTWSVETVIEAAVSSPEGHRVAGSAVLARCAHVRTGRSPFGQCCCTVAVIRNLRAGGTAAAVVAGIACIVIHDGGATAAQLDHNVLRAHRLDHALHVLRRLPADVGRAHHGTRRPVPAHVQWNSTHIYLHPDTCFCISSAHAQCIVQLRTMGAWAEERAL